LALNNEGTQSFVHGGGNEAEIIFQNHVPTDIEGTHIRYTSEEQVDQSTMLFNVSYIFDQSLSKQHVETLELLSDAYIFVYKFKYINMLYIEFQKQYI
jgi:hypothetical protein